MIIVVTVVVVVVVDLSHSYLATARFLNAAVVVLPFFVSPTKTQKHVLFRSAFLGPSPQILCLAVLFVLRSRPPLVYSTRNTPGVAIFSLVYRQ